MASNIRIEITKMSREVIKKQDLNANKSINDGKKIESDLKMNMEALDRA